MQRTVPRNGTLMSPNEEALRKTFFSAIFGGEEVDADFRKILGHSVKCGCLDILEPWSSAEIVYNTYKAARRELIGSLLGGTALNYVSNRVCVRGKSAGSR